MTLTVACVLRSGPTKLGDSYQPCHVNRLERMVLKHLHVPHRFVCLTDHDDLGCEMVPLRHSWPRWWSKLELFQHDFGPTIYFDLDMTIQGDITWLADEIRPLRLSMMQNFHAAKHGIQRPSSALMCWDGPLRGVTELFEKDPQRFILEFEKDVCGAWGDQGWLEDMVDWRLIEDDRIAHVRFGGDTNSAAVVAYGGKVRPW